MTTGQRGKDMATALIKDWYESEPERRRSRIGIPNAALHVLEVFRHHWPLREGQFLTTGGGQVVGLSGSSGDAIVARYTPSLRSMGSEAGRTSRSTPSAARRLAHRLNALSREMAADPTARASLADGMQLWIINEVLYPQLGQHSRLPVLRLDPGEPTELVLEDYFHNLVDCSWRQATTRLLTAIVAILPKTSAGNSQRWTIHEGPITLGDTLVVVSELPTFAEIETCADALASGMRCLLLTPHERSLASAQLVEAAGLSRVEVDRATRFLARLIDVASRFEPDAREEMGRRINEALASNGPN